jgi:hypothetical protein
MCDLWGFLREINSGRRIAIAPIGISFAPQKKSFNCANNTGK